MIAAAEPVPITRRTAHRVYSVGDPRRDEPVLGFVHRTVLEAAGEVRRGGGWWEPDAHLYAAPPDLAPKRSRQPAADLARLTLSSAGNTSVPNWWGRGCTAGGPPPRWRGPPASRVG
ncbi:hypothetical protein [Streptomyces sp. NPDC054865]